MWRTCCGRLYSSLQSPYKRQAPQSAFEREAPTNGHPGFLPGDSGGRMLLASHAMGRGGREVELLKCSRDTGRVCCYIYCFPCLGVVSRGKSSLAP